MNEHEKQQHLHFLHLSNEIGKRAIELGNHPFGAVLVAPDNKTVLLTQCNIDSVNHAESTLARVAASNFTPDYLWNCTLYTAVEPCCMCAGTIYWANIGKVVYGVSEEKLLECTGSHHENPTMSVPAQYIFDHGQKAIELIGPFDELNEAVVSLQKDFWANRR
ncbi:nucleoside deaminase (plasmid) [Moraxella sp. K23]|uniref:Nucleoside deaminase n=1 Tax=Faucicola osloensis TaxID=34062 RepID=A0A2I1RFM4_FAUOS|nr:nucleoside deaminase [Moraxella osloensis]PKZ67931.1 nucleoside deaminase [Moraxella osloensis]